MDKKTAIQIPKTVGERERGYPTICGVCKIGKDDGSYRWSDICNHRKWCETYRKKKEAEEAAKSAKKSKDK